MKEIFLLLGSNRGDRIAFIEQAKTRITGTCGSLLQSSSIYETEPWGFSDETSFINQAVEVDTEMSPEELMEQLLTIEAQLGRKRVGNWSPEIRNQKPVTSYSGRTIDIDILFYGSRLVFTGNLMIPHPRLHERRFALEPLDEITPTFQHPVLKKTISLLLRECTDRHKVTRLG